MRKRKAIHKAPKYKRASLYLFVLFAIAVGGLFLTYTNWTVAAQVRANSAQMASDKKDIENYIKISTAKRAEAEAKAKMEAEVKAQAESEAKIAAANAVKIAEAPQSTCGVTDPSSITVIINKKHCFNPLTWAPSDLTSLDGFILRTVSAEHMQSMMAAATAAGNGFALSSAYRSYANQVTTYNNWVAVNGSTAAADTVSARPGYSEHQTGLAADLKVGSCVLECFSTTTAYAWLQANAADYGFIQRYPSGLSSITGYAPEAWHWRYVGVDVAQDMKSKGIQTLEQYFGISGGGY